MRIFGDRPHHRDDVEDLEAALFRFLDRFLAGDHHHRHPAKLRIGSGRHEIGGPWPKRRKADAGLAGMAAIGRGHEACALLVTGQDQPDLLRSGKRVEKVQIFLAWNAKDIFDAFLLEALDEKIGCLLAHDRLPRFARCAIEIRRDPAGEGGSGLPVNPHRRRMSNAAFGGCHVQ